MSANHNSANPCHYVHESEKGQFQDCTHLVRFVTTAVHELTGHGTGKLLSETTSGQWNFDVENPPPLTKKLVDTWYKHRACHGAVPPSGSFMVPWHGSKWFYV